MSKQLAISSSFATFAMAAMVVLHMPTQHSAPGAERFMQMQAESPFDSGALDLPRQSFFAD